jgi:hypothetical protein
MKLNTDVSLELAVVGDIENPSVKNSGRVSLSAVAYPPSQYLVLQVDNGNGKKADVSLTPDQALTLLKSLSLFLVEDQNHPGIAMTPGELQDLFTKRLSVSGFGIPLKFEIRAVSVDYFGVRITMKVRAVHTGKFSDISSQRLYPLDITEVELLRQGIRPGEGADHPRA